MNTNSQTIYVEEFEVCFNTFYPLCLLYVYHDVCELDTKTMSHHVKYIVNVIDKLSSFIKANNSLITWITVKC
jgi:hypothetical protein